MTAYQMAATVDFGLDAKQGLLDLRSESARLALAARLFRAALKRLDFVERAQARARSNGRVRFPAEAVQNRVGRPRGQVARTLVAARGSGRWWLRWSRRLRTRVRPRARRPTSRCARPAARRSPARGSAGHAPR